MQNQKENTDPLAHDHREAVHDTRSRRDEPPGSGGHSKHAGGVSLRPSRKAKTKEAVQRHLNRDVELLVDEKQEKKSSTRKDKVANPANALTQVTNGINNGSKLNCPRLEEPSEQLHFCRVADCYDPNPPTRRRAYARFQFARISASFQK